MAKKKKQVFDSTEAKVALDLLERTHNESGRACGILLGELLNNDLMLLLRKATRPVKATRDLLEGAYRPLSSFSARIDVAFAMGLINEEESDDLHIVRDIRNDCAHGHLGEVVDFERALFADRIRRLNALRVYTAYAKTPAGTQAGLMHEMTARQQLFYSVGLLHCSLVFTRLPTVNTPIAPPPLTMG